MSFIALASRRVIAGTVQRSSTAAAAIGGTRQMSVADKDNILPVSYSMYILLSLWQFIGRTTSKSLLFCGDHLLLHIVEIIMFSVHMMCF